jgi:hypothetical protein
MRSLILAGLLASAAVAAPFAGRGQLGPGGGGNDAQCVGLRAQDDMLRSSFAKGSVFPDQVFAAFDGQGSGEATAQSYLARGQDLFALTDTVVSQCDATFGRGAGAAPPTVAAPILRRVSEAKRTAQLYLDLPRTIARIDAEQNPAALSLRPQFLTAMYKIADGGEYAAAWALADDAHAKLARLPR